MFLKPASNAGLTSFWNSLHGLQDKGGLLRFPVRPKFIPVHLKRLYIRESYKDLFNIIWKNQKSKDLTKRLHRMAITGTPGIGKSVFLFYVMWRLANMKTTKTVILHRRAHKRRIYIFQNEGCWRTRKISDIDDLLDDPKTWYLTDALKPPPEERDSITILVSSPAGKYYETFIKYPGTAPLYYLPTWSLEELNIAAPYFGVKPQLVESRFDKIGGIPRYVLEKDEDLGVRIKRSLGKLALGKLESIALGEVSKEDEISHLIIQFEIDPTYSDFTLNVASDYVMDAILDRYVGRRERKLRNFIADTEGLSLLSGAHARAFEGYAHRVLSRGGTFLVRSLDDDGETHELSLSKRTLRRFYDFSECTDPETYYKPMKVNHPCIDSIILNVGYFQMTTTLNHPIKEPQMRKIVERFEMDTFYFVVSDTIFEEFQRQKIEEDKESVKTVKSIKEQNSPMKRSLEEVETSIKNKRQRLKKMENDTVHRRGLVRQFVISIPISQKRDDHSNKTR